MGNTLSPPMLLGVMAGFFFLAGWYVAPQQSSLASTVVSVESFSLDKVDSTDFLSMGQKANGCYTRVGNKHIFRIATKNPEKQHVLVHEIGHFLHSQIRENIGSTPEVHDAELFAETFALVFKRLAGKFSGIDRDALSELVQVNMMETYRNHMPKYGIRETNPSVDEQVYHELMTVILNYQNNPYKKTLDEFISSL